MLNNFYIRKLLSDDEIKLINHLFYQSKQNDWIDGISSVIDGSKGINSKNIKKLKKLSNQQIIQNIHSIVMSAIDTRDEKFLDFTIAKNTSLTMATKMQVGDYYHMHHDNGLNGHYSTTLFISDKEDYDGGELCLTIDGEEKQIKLNSGEAITYSTGIPHRVNPINSGERLAIVFWTTSRISDSWLREVFISLTESANCLENNNIEKTKFLIDGIRHSILRKVL